MNCFVHDCIVSYMRKWRFVHIYIFNKMLYSWLVLLSFLPVWWWNIHMFRSLSRHVVNKSHMTYGNKLCWCRHPVMHIKRSRKGSGSVHTQTFISITLHLILLNWCNNKYVFNLPKIVLTKDWLVIFHQRQLALRVLRSHPGPTSHVQRTIILQWRADWVHMKAWLKHQIHQRRHASATFWRNVSE